jgi:hypothetical protein
MHVNHEAFLDKFLMWSYVDAEGTHPRARFATSLAVVVVVLALYYFVVRQQPILAKGEKGFEMRI